MGIYPFFFFLRWRKQNEFKLLHKQILFSRIVSTDKHNLKFKFKAFTYHECCWECWMLWLWISPSKLSEESLNDVFKETLSLVSLLMYIRIQRFCKTFYLRCLTGIWIRLCDPKSLKLVCFQVYWLEIFKQSGKL